MSILFDPYDVYIPRHTSLALSASLLTHALLFGIGWIVIKTKTPPVVKPALSVVLVNRKTLHTPKTAQSWAQANLDGSGQPNQRGHQARTALLDTPPPTIAHQQPGEKENSKGQHTAQGTQDHPTPSTPYLTRKGSSSAAFEHAADASQGQKTLTPTSTIPRPVVPPMPNVAAKLSQTLDEKQEGPSSNKALGASTREYRYASYLEGWRQKVQRIGSEHYRSVIAGRKLYGSLEISLRVRANGQLESANIRRSSGNRWLDQIALDCVKRASPFDPFPEALRAETSVMEITKTYTFEKFTFNSDD